MEMISADQLRSKISFEDLIEPVSYAFQKSSAGKAENGLIVMYPREDRSAGDVYVKTGTIENYPIHIVKVSPWFASNSAAGLRQGGFIALFDSQTGHTIAQIDEQHYLSDIRTAAAGALAARQLAPIDTKTVAVLGSGVQAYWQVRALYHERKFAKLFIAARSKEKSVTLLRRLAAELPKIEIQLADAESAVRAADVIITATAAREPILPGHWLRPGQHVTAVGADDPSKCEIDASALGRARLFVDSISANLANGDVGRAISENSYDPKNIEGEMGDLLSGKHGFRRSSDDITIAKFIGLGAQDLFAAMAVLEKWGLAQN